MARFTLGLVTGAAIMLIGGAAAGIHAQDASHDVKEVAAAAGYDVVELAGAVNTLDVDPWTYARWEGRLAPLPEPKAPPKPAYNARVECIIGKESGNTNVANRQGSGAVGVAQYMPSTFYAHAREMGHTDWSPWNPDQARAVAAHDLALGRRSQWTVGGC